MQTDFGFLNHSDMFWVKLCIFPKLLCVRFSCLGLARGGTDAFDGRDESMSSVAITQWEAQSAAFFNKWTVTINSSI